VTSPIAGIAGYRAGAGRDTRQHDTTMTTVSQVESDQSPVQHRRDRVLALRGGQPLAEPGRGAEPALEIILDNGKGLSATAGPSS